MKILVIGSGGREHAIVHALAQSPSVTKLWCAPGNPGMAQLAECVPIAADNLKSLYTFARDNKVDLTMVGPEAPLVAGIVDQFRREGLLIVGPTQSAARLEGSKSFAKEFMRKNSIPTARYEVIPNLTKGAYQLKHHWTGRSVMKADGLAAGKGVKVCASSAEAKEFLFEVMEKEIFGTAGSTMIIEECLEGEEATLMAFCDGLTLVPMPAAQDHKRLKDQDLGPNTGGMGAYAPAPVVTPALMRQIEEGIFEPFMKGLKAEGLEYRGIVYFGLMITSQGPKVLEFNVRFGDPETQVVLPLFKGDFAKLLKAIAEQQLEKPLVQWKNQSAACVVLASGGYPASVSKGDVIKGLPKTLGKNTMVFHAGTAQQGEEVVTAGGRVLGVTAVADTFEEARQAAYDQVKKISFDGMQYRGDIGARAVAAVNR